MKMKLVTQLIIAMCVLVVLAIHLLSFSLHPITVAIALNLIILMKKIDCESHDVTHRRTKRIEID